ncbi:ATP-dependent helicase HrpB [Halarcobacter anaerophilus]|uniref:ATP-dependent helicase HrpB n=1 Tax=Halarcobacter anaerophilus TaxID=877500 RepID=A0A4Q0Y5E0_9BACT|nr:ATP-dependent helicase HrpB [Halarcobacter anaerophilus]QDF29322.1 ATP-dependent helicase HrpB [Halarcobacter anaerophilus]RXJ64885.1 ATP-dependent helicase HrpB [Halarcobacter anaerophilus]
MKNLPIHDVLDDIKSRLNHNSTLILQAPPGAGKSTVVPISLLNESWLEGKMIIMLEPRRVAARMVAEQMARLLNEKVGQSVGYQVKMDSCFSKSTKLLVVTEAILVRKLQNDQALEDVAMVIFDEFHERSIHTDLSLALSLQVQELLRDDLKLLIMSATLDSSELQNLLGKVPVITSKGKAYSVENIYLEANIKQPDIKSINTTILNTIFKALEGDDGDILVFLAGSKEIRRLKTLLEERLKNKKEKEIEVFPLYSALSKIEQDRAIRKSKKRKIILATNIAQTSLTIEGVKVVIDTGLEKLALYNYSTGMNHLNLSFISEDSAIQRAGRAGRLSEGKCYRLWHKSKILQKATKPEILRCDLSSFFLDLALWGTKDIKELNFLDYPQKEVEAGSKEMLQELKMLDENYEITSIGKKALSLGVHPRFAFMILKANDLGFAYEASLLSSLLSEKDIFKNTYTDSDIYLRFIHLYEKEFDNTYINSYLAKNILKQAQFFYSKLKAIQTVNVNKTKIDEETLAVLLLFAYPDRLAHQREKNENRYKLSNGKGAILNPEDSLFNEEFLIAPVLNAQNKNSYINLALKISLHTIEEKFASYIKRKKSIIYNKENKKFDTKEEYYFYELKLYSKPISLESEYDFSKLLLDLIKKEGLELLTWSKKANDLKNRINFINENMDIALPSFETTSLLDTMQEWLTPYLNEIKTIKQLEALDLYSILLGRLSWENQQLIDTLAPSYIKVPSGSNIKIDYSNSKTPILAVKIQEIFGLKQTPKILDNKIALQIHLLSPAQRPIQITYDLKSFWENSYEEVRKELFSKYKKHYWPENPFEAVATNKTKKNMMKDKRL